VSAARSAPSGAGKAPPGTPPLVRVLRSFGFAARGIVHLFRTQPNAWVHGLAAVLVALFAWWLERSPAETGVLLLAIGLVLAAEALNTAVEAVVDLASPEYHELARVAKDTAAGGVLLAAVMAALVGLVILGPPLVRRMLG
jgi:diacylglycerol kinase